MASWLAIK